MEIKYHSAIKKDLSKISPANRQRIKSSIENKLTKNPVIFSQPLRYTLRNYRKLRVGNYRIVFRIQKSVLLVLAIKHRSEIYKKF